MDPRKPMDLDTPSSTSRKVRFAPKAPPRRISKPAGRKNKTATPNDDADEKKTAQKLLSQARERLGRQGPKVENKSSVQVAFTHGVASSPSIRTYVKPKEGRGNTISSDLNDTDSDNGKNHIDGSSFAGEDGVVGNSVGGADALSEKNKKNYREPWDYHGTDYPISLPLRRPYSGNPELLDKVEFGEDVQNLEYDENILNAASELGLLPEENEDAQMLFLQLPPNLPFFKRSESAEEKERAGGLEFLGSRNASASRKGKDINGSSLSLDKTVTSNRKGKEIASSVMSSRDSGVSAISKGKGVMDYSVSSAKGYAPKAGCSLDELPGGFMGKMLVYKSGAIKLKLGENLYDVSQGLDTIVAQDVVAINTTDKHCCMLGELGKRAVVTPNIDSVLDNFIELD